jgi:hypothetical protein
MQFEIERAGAHLDFVSDTCDLVAAVDHLGVGQYAADQSQRCVVEHDDTIDRAYTRSVRELPGDVQGQRQVAAVIDVAGQVHGDVDVAVRMSLPAGVRTKEVSELDWKVVQQFASHRAESLCDVHSCSIGPAIAPATEQRLPLRAVHEPKAPLQWSAATAVVDRKVEPPDERYNCDTNERER